MKITAILCNYNGEAYLAESIRSVLSQTRKPDEFIIVDDGSTDSSRELIKEITAGHPEVRFIQHEANQGQAAGFNTAISAAKGDWLCFIDSDDMWAPHKIESVAALVADADDVVMIQHPLRIIEGTTETTSTVPPAMTFGDLWHSWNHQIYFPTFVPTSGLSIRADIAKKILPVPTNLRHSADSFLTRAVIAHGKVAAITEALGDYRQHDQNAVHGKESHDSWGFLLREVAPHLHSYYLSNSFPSPIQKYLKPDAKSKLSKLLDMSPRKILTLINHLKA